MKEINQKLIAFVRAGESNQNKNDGDGELFAFPPMPNAGRRIVHVLARLGYEGHTHMMLFDIDTVHRLIIMI